jgi:uncharacterized membrane protein
LDGTVVAGGDANGAFVYGTKNADLSYPSLGTLTGTAAAAVSGDGSMIGGSSQTDSWLWDSAHGVRLIPDVLTALGVNLDGYSGIGIRGISQDGKAFAGTCYRNNVFTGYIARL